MTFPLTLIFMFLVFWRPQEWLLPWMFGLPVLDAVTYAALLALAMEMSQSKDGFPRTPAIGLAAGLWGASILSHVPHTYFQGIIDTFPETFKVCFFLLLLLVVINRIERVRWVTITFVLCAVIMAIHCHMQQRTGAGFGGAPPLMVYKAVENVWQPRSQFFGIFSDPNDTAQFLATCIPLVFAIPFRLNPLNRILGCLVIWLMVTALLGTHSRGGMVALIVVGMTMLFLQLPVRWMPYVGGVALLGGLVMCAVKGGSMLDESARERVVFWGQANREFKHNPIFGLGYGMFWQVTEEARAAHNAFVLCYTELGLFGYWFWFTTLQLGVIGCWRTRMAFRRPRTVAQAYLRRVSGLAVAAIAGFAAGAYFLSRAYVFPLFFLFGLLCAIPVIAQRLLPEDAPPIIDTRRDVLVAGTIGTLVSVAYIYVSILILNKTVYG